MEGRKLRRVRDRRVKRWQKNQERYKSPKRIKKY